MGKKDIKEKAKRAEEKDKKPLLLQASNNLNQ